MAKKQITFYIDEETSQKLEVSRNKFIDKQGWHDLKDMEVFKLSDYLRLIINKYLEEEVKNEPKI